MDVYGTDVPGHYVGFLSCPRCVWPGLQELELPGAEPSPLGARPGLLLNSLGEEPLEGLARLLALAVLGGVDAAGPAR